MLTPGLEVAARIPQVRRSVVNRSRGAHPPATPSRGQPVAATAPDADAGDDVAVDVDPGEVSTPFGAGAIADGSSPAPIVEDASDVRTDSSATMPAVEIAFGHAASNSPSPSAVSTATKDCANDLSARSPARCQKSFVNMVDPLDPMMECVQEVRRDAGDTRDPSGVPFSGLRTYGGDMADRLSQDQIADALSSSLTDWQLEGGDTIRRDITAETFRSGIALVDQVAAIADSMDHHPDIDIRWTTITFRLSTHSEGGLTDNDLRLAAEIDRLAP